MASVNIWSTGDILSVRCYKSLTTAPDKVWANSYEFRVDSPTPDASGSNVALAQAIAAYEANIHLNDVQFERVVISTYVPDGQPYNPASFVSVPVTYLLGGVTGYPADQREPLNLCLRVTRATVFGRRGYSLYRRCLAEDQVTSVAGTPALTTEAALAFASALADTFTIPSSPEATTFDQYLTDAGLSHVLASGSAGSLSVRSVTARIPNGVTVKAFNNRYFDRA